MHESLKGGLIALLVFFSMVTQGLDLSKLNLSFQYDLTIASHISYRIVQTDAEKLSVIYETPGDTTRLWGFSILGQNGYSSPTHDTLSLDLIDTMFVDGRRNIYTIEVPKRKYDLLIFSIYNLSQGIYRIYDVSLNAPGGYPGFYPMDGSGVPILQNYTSEEEIFFSEINSPLHVFQYRERFGPADPPMGEVSTLAPTISIDSAYFFDSSTTIDNNYFYLFQRDTLDNTGITLLKCPYYYPDLRTYDELIQPLRYISTSTENQMLIQATNKRKAFEDFWLTNYGTKFRAKGAIRFFYQRVEDANMLFTDYKQGWKTDRGILYIIYGPPAVVVKTDRIEQWRYDSGERFEFIRIPILFTPSLYSLKRKSDYEKSWYNQVGEIRKGQ